MVADARIAYCVLSIAYLISRGTLFIVHGFRHTTADLRHWLIWIKWIIWLIGPGYPDRLLVRQKTADLRYLAAFCRRPPTEKQAS